MTTKEDYEEMVEMSETLMEGGKRQIQLAAFIKDKTEKLLEAIEEGKVKIDKNDDDSGSSHGSSHRSSDKEDRKKLAVVITKKAMA